ncbi:unnamed protein product [Blepharisma stoltei]|uniref:Glucosidase II subunit alpha n=1 Tax=Blepharisma stoltei TaxID=1481888 RepID=A0AAU9JTX0_9CILI|nr:unnamed protein product [Blepharisma stoltei]
MYTNGALHVYIDEISPIHKRFKTPQEDLINEKAINKVPNQHVKIEADKIIWELGKIRYVLKISKFMIEGFYGKDLTIIANKNSFMNFERYRNKNVDLKPKNQSKDISKPIKILDATGAYIEKNGNLETQPNLWNENFKQFNDKKQFGPSSIALDFTFVNSTHIFGIPEHADSLALKDTVKSEPYRLYNLDVFEYELNERMALYGSIPFILSRTIKKFSSGVFWSNPSETYIDINSQNNDKITHWISEAGVLEFYLFQDESPLKIIESFTLLTGPPQLPPLFSLGYHQSRWNYNSEKDLLDVADGFNKYQIPVDVFWLDIEHTPERTYFKWDYRNFPTPTEMQKKLESMNKKLVTIVDPHMKRSDSYFVHKEMQSKGYYVKTDKGYDFEGHCWPGSSSWPDFTRPEVRDYWSSLFDFSKYKDSTEILFVWNDMNEPSVFSGPEITMPKDNFHGNYEHREVHNIYGLYMQRATSEGLVKRRLGGYRPFVLSRAFYAGVQKYGAIWTGDNNSKWSHLEYSMPMCLSIAVAGLSFCGADVGGFFGNPDTNLLVRWYQLGAYMPFFRGHSHIETRRREPWLYNEPYLSQIRQAINERYSLLPYWYTLFYIYHIKGTPIIRPMFVEYPNDNIAADLDKQFHVGPGLLVAGITMPNQQEIPIYLPEAIWYDYHTFQKINENGAISYKTNENWVPVFIKGGNVIIRYEKAKMSTSDMKSDPISIIIVLNKEKKAKGMIYLDDTETFKYQSGEFVYAEIEFKENSIRYKILNQMNANISVGKITVLGLDFVPKVVALENSSELFTLGYYVKEESLIISEVPAKISEEWTIYLS